jgi:hypothetical protein
MKNIYTAALAVLICGDLAGQVLKGTIRDSSGEPVPYASVYIRELQQGTTANSKGDYELRLKQGTYTVIYQNLGYAPDIRNLTIGKTNVNLDIILHVQYYELPEVRITASGEDPAYGIMRKVIGLAPYYLNQVSYYKAEVYLKGNLVINKIPKILQKTLKMEVRSGSGSANSKQFKKGDSYMMESFNILEFNAPDKYVQRVISQQSAFPEQGNVISPMDFIETSFYQPVLADMAISPLSPQAFSHYNFKYLGSSLQGDFTINKIQVSPKRKSQQLFEGSIFIIEDLWCLHSIDLVNENIAGKIKIQQLYIPVSENIWMPVSHKFEMNISIIGVKADAGYGSSVKYLEVRPNKKLTKPETSSLDFGKKTSKLNVQSDSGLSKSRKQIDKILSKEELSNRDMMKLSALLDKESRKSQDDSLRRNLEIKDPVTHIIEKDAIKKDSSYWAEIRPIPLSDAEMRSLRISDSLKSRLAPKTEKKDTTLVKKNEKSKITRLLKGFAFGHSWSDSTGSSFTFGGLLRLKKLNFDPINGFSYGVDFRLSKSWKNGNSLSFFPDIRYAFSRQQPMWKLNAQYRFDRMEQRLIYLRTGMSTADLNYNGGPDPFVNSISALFFKKNYLKLYESDFIVAGFRTEIVNGFYADLSAAFEDRFILSNSTDYSFAGRSAPFDENVPDNPFLKDYAGQPNLLGSQRHFNFTAIFRYTPLQKYRIRNNVKIAGGSDWPTLALTWKHGINQFPDLGSEWKQFDMIKFSISKRKEMAGFREIDWSVTTGGFLDNRNVPFYDFFHFSSQQMPVLLNNYRDAFMLPGYYSLSTPEFFTEGHVRYTTPCFLLKRLPGLSNTLILENLSASAVWSRYQPLYTEAGYSLSRIFLIGEAGVYTGFENFSFKSAGVKVVLMFN